MSNKYSYDSTGLPSSYLLLTILIPIFLYLSFKEIKFFYVSLTERRCCCSAHNSLTNSDSSPLPSYSFSSHFRTWHMSFRLRFLLFIIVPLISYLTHHIISLKDSNAFFSDTESTNRFNPYKIFGLEEDHSVNLSDKQKIKFEKKVKKIYRKLVKTHDPDKNGITSEEKSKRMDYLVKVNKAYGMLMSKEKMENVLNDKMNMKEIVCIPNVVFKMFGDRKVIKSEEKKSDENENNQNERNEDENDKKEDENAENKSYNDENKESKSNESKNDDKDSYKGWYLSLSIVFVIILSYTSFITILLPFYAFNAWKKSINLNSQGTNYKTAEIIYKRMKKSIETNLSLNSGNDRWIIDLFCLSIEGSDKKFKWSVERKYIRKVCRSMTKIKKINEKGNLNENKTVKDSKDNFDIFDIKKINCRDENTIKVLVKSFIESHFAYPIKHDQPIQYYVLIDHLFRTRIFTKQTRKEVVEKFTNMIHTIRLISLGLSNINYYIDTFVCEKMVTQAIFDESYGKILQMPGKSFLDVIMERHLGEHKHIALADDDVHIPRIEILNVEAYVEGEENEKKNENDNEEGTTEEKNENININERVKNNNFNRNIEGRENRFRGKRIINITEIEDLSDSKKNFVVFDPLSKFNSSKTFDLPKKSIVTVKITLAKYNKKEKNVINEEKSEKNSYFVKTKGKQDLKLRNSLSGIAKKTRVHAPYTEMLYKGSDLKKYNEKEGLLQYNILFVVNDEISVESEFCISDFEGNKDIFYSFEGKNKEGETDSVRAIVMCRSYWECDSGVDFSLKYF